MRYLLYLFIGVAAFCLGWYGRSGGGCAVRRDTVTSVRVVTRVDVDTLYILRPLPYVAWVDSTDTICVGDSCGHLREYREYGDSSFYARVSGVRPRLDEIRVYPRTEYRTEYVYRDVYRGASGGRWGLGVSAGYGVCRGGLSPMVGVTVSYSILRW